MRQLPKNLAQGQAGVYTVASQLLLRGFNPCFPAVDIGADILTDTGIKIQVKSARIQKNSAYKNGAYWFKLATRAVVAKGVVQKRVSRVFSQECDFAVLWGVDENRFWIVPAAILDGHQLVVVGPESRWVDVDLDNLREKREAKKTFDTISQETGISVGTIFRSLNGREANAKTTLTNQVRECENRWDSLEAFERTVEAIDGATTQVAALESLVQK